MCHKSHTPGITVRARPCFSAVFGGNDCQGKSTETKSCSALGIINILLSLKPSNQIVLFSGNTSSIEFFEKSFTFANETNNVTCCHQSSLQVSIVSCGLGASCAGQCSAMGAILCPSGVCTERPRDCVLNMDAWAENRTQEIQQNKTRSLVTQSSNTFGWCSPKCKVNKYPGCCFNPECYKKRKKFCKFQSYMTGMHSIL